MSAAPNKPLWHIVPLAEFALPPTPVQEVATKRMHALRRLFRSESAPQPPAMALEDLRNLPEARLAHLAPPIDWRRAADALTIQFAEWAKADDAAKMPRFLVGPPYGGHAEVLEFWAASHGWHLIAPPASEHILADDPAWLEDANLPRDAWVLPHLEHCFLRHGDGLVLIRRFLDLAASGCLGRGLIGCDSWAWAFLQRIWPIPQSQIYTLQAFDGDRLAAYFQYALHDPMGRRIRVRNAKTGDDILCSADSDAAPDPPVSALLKRLAAHCRGNLGIAWNYWRTGFRTEPDAATPEVASANADAIEASEPADEVTLWWTAEHREPELSPTTEDELTHLLHALLLHNGLSQDLLAELLPDARMMLGANLLRLEHLGLIDRTETIWRVAPLGYAVVREWLGSRGYLIDDQP
jgi:hypothetical protein